MPECATLPPIVEAAQRLTLRVVPGSLQPALARMHRPLARHLAAGKYRRKYAGRFLSDIHPDDDLLHYGLDVAGAHPAFRYYHAVQSYFAGGEWNAAEVEKVLCDAGFTLRGAESVLEFACGWGRVTRHLVHLVDPARMTVSDIDRRAVDFVTTRLGVRGFYSTATPGELVDDGSYDVIAVVSLFSHLPPDSWAPWIDRLCAFLLPGGVLVFSTLGLHTYDAAVNDADKQAFVPVADGCLYAVRNETRGRLPGGQYGTAYVSEDFVRRAVESDERALVRYVPRALNGFQDAYLVRASVGTGRSRG